MSFGADVQSEWNGREVKIRGKKVIGKSVFETGLVVEGQAKLLCPVKTGRLAASITVQMLDRGTVPSGTGARPTDVIAAPTVENMAYVGTPVDYGPWQEFGTMRNEAQAFLRPALDLARGKELTIVKYNGRLQFGEYLKVSA